MSIKLSAIAFVCFITFMLLAGCGHTAASQENDVGKDSQEASEQMEGSSDDTGTEASVKKSAKSAGENAEPESGQTGGSEDHDFAGAFEENRVYNNGTYFVRIGDKVYFRDIQPGSMFVGATFGEFLNTEYIPTECPLICYDTDTSEWEEIGRITGVGELYACPEGFYIGEPDQDDLDNSCTDLYDPATGDTSFYCTGLPLGVSKSGKLLAVSQHLGQSQSMGTVLIKDGKEIVSLGDMDTYYNYCGFADEDLILMQQTDDESILCSVNEDGEVTRLGQIGIGQTSFPELEDFIFFDNELYLTFGYYEGTGHFLYDYETVKAVPGKKGSLEEADIFDDESGEDPENTVPKVCFEPEGVAFYSPHRPYVAYMGTEDNGNNMYCYNDIYEECLLVRDFIDVSDHEDCSIIQDMESIAETAFVIYADAEEDSEYEIGWRTGYRMTGWHICAIPFDSEHLDENGQAKSVIYFEGEKDGTDNSKQMSDKKEEGDPLEGLVSDDILTKFRKSNPVMSSATVEKEALRLGSWVQENIDRIPDSIREEGEEIGRNYEFWFGTDVGNDFDHNFPEIYSAYYSLKDYYTSDGERSSDFYDNVAEENEFFGNGDPENIEKMYSDMKDFITGCNNIIRNK